jgi:hypothetical protein
LSTTVAIFSMMFDRPFSKTTFCKTTQMCNLFPYCASGPFSLSSHRVSNFTMLSPQICYIGTCLDQPKKQEILPRCTPSTLMVNTHSSYISVRSRELYNMPLSYVMHSNDADTSDDFCEIDLCDNAYLLQKMDTLIPRCDACKQREKRCLRCQQELQSFFSYITVQSFMNTKVFKRLHIQHADLV